MAGSKHAAYALSDAQTSVGPIRNGRRLVRSEGAALTSFLSKSNDLQALQQSMLDGMLDVYDGASAIKRSADSCRITPISLPDLP